MVLFSGRAGKRGFWTSNSHIKLSVLPGSMIALTSFPFNFIRGSCSKQICFNPRLSNTKDSKKWYLMPPCSTLSIIRYGSRVKWSNPGKGVVPSPTPWCSSYRKRCLQVTLNYGRLLYLLYLLPSQIWHGSFYSGGATILLQKKKKKKKKNKCFILSTFAFWGAE